jgi:hypothetical protein
VNGSSNLKAHWSNHQWVDVKSVNNGDWAGDFWHPEENDTTPWIEIDLGESMKVTVQFSLNAGIMLNHLSFSINQEKNGLPFTKAAASVKKPKKFFRKQNYSISAC